MQAAGHSDLVPAGDSDAIPVTSKRSATGEVMVLEVAGLGQPELDFGFALVQREMERRVSGVARVAGSDPCTLGSSISPRDLWESSTDNKKPRTYRTGPRPRWRTSAGL